MDWSYLAGFIDGEGSIKCYSQQFSRRNEVDPRMQPRITIGQKHREVLDEIQLFLGTEYKITLSRNCYYLQISHEGTVRFILEGILPYTIVKKADVETALAVYAERDRQRALTEEARGI